MTTLITIQRALCDFLSGLPAFKGKVPVISEIDGDVVAERAAVFVKKHLAVVVGAAKFEPQSRDSRVITGMAQIIVTVYEQPTRNRIGQSLIGPTVTSAAEYIACAAHLMRYNSGVLAFAGISDVLREDDKTVSRNIMFETLTTLTGEL